MCKKLQVVSLLIFFFVKTKQPNFSMCLFSLEFISSDATKKSLKLWYAVSQEQFDSFLTAYNLQFPTEASSPL